MITVNGQEYHLQLVDTAGQVSVSESRAACLRTGPAARRHEDAAEKALGSCVCGHRQTVCCVFSKRLMGVFSNSLFFYFRICFKYIHGGVVKVYIYYRIVFYFLNIDSVSEDHISAFPPFEIRLLLH